jgi:hypothetical protein
LSPRGSKKPTERRGKKKTVQEAKKKKEGQDAIGRKKRTAAKRGNRGNRNNSQTEEFSVSFLCCYATKHEWLIILF